VPGELLEPVGRVASTTKPLPRRGRRVRNIGVFMAVSTLLAARPSALASQMSASENSTSRPSAPSHSSGLASERKPSAIKAPS